MMPLSSLDLHVVHYTLAVVRYRILIASLMIRFELGVMNIVLLRLQDYNVTITTHGLLMIFFL